MFRQCEFTNTGKDVTNLCGKVASKYGQRKVILPLTKSMFSSETNWFFFKGISIEGEGKLSLGLKLYVVEQYTSLAPAPPAKNGH